MIASLRKSDEVSQTALANKLHISKAHLCDIEKGRRMVSVERAIAFANALGYSPIQFATRALEDQLRSAGLNVQVHLKAV
ncbi:MAG: helix-turn-helix transcriptional regulator [Bdellovibrio sp.]|nr:helix-turn-helix transcriptional regulator [Bdellovibrio sp.]